MEWWVQNGPITRNGVLTVTTSFFWKFCFSLRTPYKELIWCTNDLNAHIPTFCRRWSFIRQCFSLWVSLKTIYQTRNQWIKHYNNIIKTIIILKLLKNIKHGGILFSSNNQKLFIAWVLNQILPTCVLGFLIAIPTNLSTILFVRRRRELHTTTNIFCE